MRRGQRVVLVDLVGRSDLNGRTGFVCKAADDPNGRLGVQLQPGEEQPVALRSQNLVLGAAVPELPSELWDAIFCRSDRRAILRQRAVSAQWQGAILPPGQSHLQRTHTARDARLFGPPVAARAQSSKRHIWARGRACILHVQVHIVCMHSCACATVRKRGAGGLFESEKIKITYCHIGNRGRSVF